jgi:hypoxanthine phosphoribosyltransferase
MELIGIASYGDETKSSRRRQITHDLTKPIEGKHVIVVEDIVDTGAHHPLPARQLRHPPAEEPEGRVAAAQARARAAEGADRLPRLHHPERVRGRLRLDFAQRYRNLPFIGVVEGAGELGHDPVARSARTPGMTKPREHPATVRGVRPGGRGRPSSKSSTTDGRVGGVA